MKGIDIMQDELNNSSDESLILDTDTEDTILPEGWDGESDIFADIEEEDLENPTTDEEEKPEEESEEKQETEDNTQAENTAEIGVEGGDRDSQEAKPQEQEKPTIRVKFNHEEKDISYDEAVPYIQKGMNFDRLESTFNEGTKLAKELGYQSMSEMIQAAKENYINGKVQELVDEGVHEDVARMTVEHKMQTSLHQAELAEAQAEAQAQQERMQAEAQAQQNAQEARMQELKTQVEQFKAVYPNVTQLPPEVADATINGTPLIVAYARYEAKQAQKELQTYKQQQETAKRAPVKGATKHGDSGEQAEDLYLAGFDDDSW